MLQRLIALLSLVLLLACSQAAQQESPSPESTARASELYQRLKRKGLLVVPGKYFFPGQAVATDHAESCVRMNYVQSEADLEKGIRILARELRDCW